MRAIPGSARRLPKPGTGIILTLAAAATLLAQQASTIHVDVKVVNVLATVRDKSGNIVTSLTKDDFTLEEDGRPQTIKYFARETDQPLTLGLLVDTSWSQTEKLGQEKTASAAFANEVLREGKDSAFLLHFDREAELLRDLTTSREKLVSALQALEIPPYERQQSGDPDDSGRGSRGRSGGGTVLYDSVFLASDELMQKQPGRKAIILLTDGVDHGSKMSLESAIEAAQRADTMVYSIYFPGEEGGRRRGLNPPWGGGRRGGGWPGPGGGNWPGGGGGGGGGRQGPSSEPRVDGKLVLERLSRETGGRLFEVSKKEPIEKIYAQIQDELRNQYNLGYTSDRAPGEGFEYRHIFLATKRPDLTVQAREGYYASEPIAPKQGQ